VLIRATAGGRGKAPAAYLWGAIQSNTRQARESTPVIARFSVAGGNPTVPDATKNARGMALEFRLPDGSRQHMTMLNTPVFGAANPSTFNDMIIASKPDPKTGKPDPQKLHAFLASHPDALAQSDFLVNDNPPESYASDRAHVQRPCTVGYG
jgi:catalase